MDISTRVSTPAWNAIRFLVVSTLFLTSVKVSMSKALGHVRGRRVMKGGSVKLKTRKVGRLSLHAEIDENSFLDRALVRIIAAVALVGLHRTTQFFIRGEVIWVKAVDNHPYVPNTENACVIVKAANLAHKA